MIASAVAEAEPNVESDFWQPQDRLHGANHVEISWHFLPEMMSGIKFHALVWNVQNFLSSKYVLPRSWYHECRM